MWPIPQRGFPEPRERTWSSRPEGRGGHGAGSGLSSSPRCGLGHSRSCGVLTRPEGRDMADTVYRVTEVIGTSSESWEAAARTAVETAAKSGRDLRIAGPGRSD